MTWPGHRPPPQPLGTLRTCVCSLASRPSRSEPQPLQAFLLPWQPARRFRYDVIVGAPVPALPGSGHRLPELRASRSQGAVVFGTLSSHEVSRAGGRKGRGRRPRGAGASAREGGGLGPASVSQRLGRGREGRALRSPRGRLGNRSHTARPGLRGETPAPRLRARLLQGLPAVGLRKGRVASQPPFLTRRAEPPAPTW